ncbi:hypothetical protein [Comamonas kerstersii]|uniref:hypothetical protein n=1 Tax=Comamonas kerstersii TaxID=225992 RepID=UPI0009856DC2|nr:hypothetical protein [Comamonas kerstersii]OOH86246.1 hypothetical protein BMF38_08920 [Comamonas kerstersii]OOH92327.1 hypothetical protein BMF29_08550 [Comamonas kerstersii]
MTKAWPWVCLGLAALVGIQQYRVDGLKLELASVQLEQAQAAKTSAEQSKEQTEEKAGALLSHASQQQDNVYEYRQTIEQLQAARSADAGRIASLQHSLQSTATQYAQAASDAAACRDLADQHQRLAARLAEGAGVVGELVGIVEQRDAQVMLLKGQVDIERSFLIKK